jgi:hypothetical protein
MIELSLMLLLRSVGHFDVMIRPRSSARAALPRHGRRRRWW